MLPKKRPPTHPGKMLLKEFLEPLEITQKDFAMEAEFWLNLQRDWDLWHAAQQHKKVRPFAKFMKKSGDHHGLDYI